MKSLCYWEKNVELADFIMMAQVQRNNDQRLKQAVSGWRRKLLQRTYMMRLKKKTDVWLKACWNLKTTSAAITELLWWHMLLFLDAHGWFFKIRVEEDLGGTQDYLQALSVLSQCWGTNPDVPWSNLFGKGLISVWCSSSVKTSKMFKMKILEYIRNG